MSRTLACLTAAAALASTLGTVTALAIPPGVPESPVKVIRGNCPSGYSELGWVGTNREYTICQRNRLVDPPV